MYQALYRQYRPEIFEDVIGQDTIVNILKGQIEMDKLVHAYLFSGTRGTGKTTTARLLAKAVNCISHENKPCGVCENCKSIQQGTFIDLIEIDAASNNGVNDIRELREGVNFPPAMGKMKVYIIDEVHALTKEAFNAFLKTLEEPPQNVLFILATTEPNKLPATILSRCLRLDFKRVSERELAERMAEILQMREVEIDEASLMLIAANADGSVRDGLTLLEQCIAGRKGRIDREEILEALGTVSEDFFIEIVDSILLNNPSRAIIKLSRAIDKGTDARQILLGLLNHYRNLLLVKFIENPENSINMSFENIQKIKKQAEKMDLWKIDDAVMELANTSKQMDASTQPRILLEVCLVKLATKRNQGSQDGMYFEEKYISRKVDLSSKEEGDINSKAKLDKSIEVRSQFSENQASLRNFEEEKIIDKKEEKQDLELNPAKIWSQVEKRLVEESPKFMVLNNTRAVDIKNGELLLEFKNNMVSAMIFQNDKLINNLLNEVCGRALTIKIQEKSKSNQIDEEEARALFKELAGINLEIK